MFKVTLNVLKGTLKKKTQEKQNCEIHKCKND